jgi:prepilin-type N-terminal cleavage/methylation domain-containing protein
MRKDSGFSIIELLMVIAMIAIILSFGLPSLMSYRSKAQLGKASRDVFGGMQKAKMEAARNNRFCVFSFSAINVGGVNYDFHVFVDYSDPRNYIYDAGVDDFITGYRSKNYPGVQIDNDYGGGTGMTFPTESGNPVVAFAPDGLPKKLDGTLGAGSLYFSDGNANGREISVSLVGNVQISQYEANP